MATYYKVPVTVPAGHRTSYVTAIAVGDQIPIDYILGRPAKGIKLITGDSADEISYLLNNKFTSPTKADTLRKSVRELDTLPHVEIWSAAPGFSEFTVTGATEHTIDGLNISAIEITALTLASGSTIEMMVW